MSVVSVVVLSNGMRLLVAHNGKFVSQRVALQSHVKPLREVSFSGIKNTWNPGISFA